MAGLLAKNVLIERKGEAGGGRYREKIKTE